MTVPMHRMLLMVYRRLPRGLRRRAVRMVAPSFTVGSVCVIERDDGARLLVRQVYRNGWGLPGGLIKRGEDVADCARREVLEEVGLEVELVGEPAVVVAPTPQRVDVVYRARPMTGRHPSTAKPSSPEIDEVGWFRADEMPALQGETVGALVALDRAARQRDGAGAPVSLPPVPPDGAAYPTRGGATC